MKTPEEFIEDFDDGAFEVPEEMLDAEERAEGRKKARLLLRETKKLRAVLLALHQLGHAKAKKIGGH